MKRIAAFEKVSKAQFIKDRGPKFPQEGADAAYEAITLPLRATAGSAGYDICLAEDVELAPGETVRIPTGLRCRMENGWVLLLFPRSGLSFRNGVRLDNTVGVIDADYYGADNEGHIQVQMTNGGKPLSLKTGQAFCQGVFVPFGITETDAAEEVRTGGFGSTGK